MSTTIRLLSTMTLLSATLGMAQAAVLQTVPIVLAAQPINLLVNGDFEASNVGFNDYKYINNIATSPVSASGWAFDGAAGVANHSVAWGGEAQGSSMLFLQSATGLGTPSVTQVFSGTYGSVTIMFTAAQRPNNLQSLRVLLDGVDLTPNLLKPVGFRWNDFTLASGPLSGDSHTLQFIGVNTTTSADVSLFIDNVVINADVPEPGSLALAAAALLGLGAARRQLIGRRRTPSNR